MPQVVGEVRAELCAKCPTPCERFKAGAINHADPCEECPLSPPRWGQYGECKNFGLGDAVAFVAQPIARAIDAVAGTNLKNCGGCGERRKKLNEVFPIRRSPNG